MIKKIVTSIYYIALALFVLSFVGACVPKQVTPTDDAVLHETTQAALANAQNGNNDDDDDDEDVAWESDNATQLGHSQRLAKGYSRANTTATGSTGDLLLKARTALGTPYVRGGTSRNGGFDCSGFVQWSYNHVGIQLPRTAREQSQVGKLVRRVDDMQAGDIVAFRHPRRGYHTGIYVGDGKFIHSPRKRNVVRINSLDDPYFSTTFMGARRLNVSNEGDIEAAEKMLAAYATQPPSPKYTSSKSSRNKKSAVSSKRGSKKTDTRSTRKGKVATGKNTKATNTKVVAAKGSAGSKKGASSAAKKNDTKKTSAAKSTSTKKTTDKSSATKSSR